MLNLGIVGKHILAHPSFITRVHVHGRTRTMLSTPAARVHIIPRTISLSILITLGCSNVLALIGALSGHDHEPDLIPQLGI